MKHEHIARSLRVLRKTFEPMLAYDAPSVLEDAADRVVASYGLYLKKRLPFWGYEIKPERPLIFQPRDVRGLELQVDMFCKILWTDPASPPCDQSLIIRIWALDDSVYYRPDLDNESLFGQVVDGGRGRVMVKYRFDRALPNLMEPETHMQCGGVARAEEYTWLHPQIGVPRIAYPAMDLVLASELVAANFLGVEGLKAMVKDPTWLDVVKQSEEYFLADFYARCIEGLRNEKKSMYQLLWANDWAEVG